MSSKGIATCVFDEALGKFRVTRSKGKSIGCGGYGVTHTIRTTDALGEPISSTSTISTTTVTHDYLFVEEVLFLHERGLLEVYRYDDGLVLEHQTPNQQEQQHETAVQQQHEKNSVEPPQMLHPKSPGNIMTTRDIYHLMLHKLNMQLAVYLTYSHLRSQTFIVLRHTSKRIDIIRRLGQYMQSERQDGKKSIKRKRSNISQDNHLFLESENEPNDTSKDHDKSSLASLKKELRVDSFLARPPQLMSVECNCQTTDDHEGDVSQQSNNCSGIHSDINNAIAFDVYNPNSNFKKTMPGMPDFLVSIVPFSQPTDFVLLQSMIRHCDGIPLKIAAISESGTVSMFGISDLGVPSISSS